MSAIGKRTRTSTPRVRTGCLTCRKRHVKCDETKPACLKCVKAGWNCDGYAASNPSAIESRKASTALSIKSYSIPFQIPGSQKDRQSLHYFCVHGASEMAGYLHHDFWTRTILQESHREPVVRQALVSMSSLHLDYSNATEPGSDASRREALMQYGRALRALQRRLEKSYAEGVKAALVCCILFFCFEATLGNSEAAMHHLQSGLKILSTCQQTQGPEGIEDLDVLTRVFERLDLQATLFDEARSLHMSLVTNEEQDVAGSVDAFQRLGDADQALVQLQHSFFRFLTTSNPYKCNPVESIPASVLQEKHHLGQKFKIWKTKFRKLEQRADQDEQLVCGIRTLFIHWQVSSMLLEADYPADEAVFGANPNLNAREVIDMVDSVLQHTNGRNLAAEATRNPRRKFSSDTGVVAPLFILAMKCSDETVCNHAAQLLAASQRREGLYSSEDMTAVLTQLTAAKEQKLLQLEGTWVENAEPSSLEDIFEHEINRASGGMDKKAEFVNI